MERLNSRLLALAGGEIDRLIVSMPPRFGKSELCSHFLPVWYAGSFPRSKVVIASYEHDFAKSWSVKARRTFGEVCDPLFRTGVRSDVDRGDHWEALNESSVFAAGVGGPLTGRGMTLGILDDPVKNAEEANSQSAREKLWEWYNAVFMTRLERNGKVLVIGTRWHVDDLIGRLIENQKHGGDKWEVLNLPALDEQGESLCPELFPSPVLQQKRSSMGSYLWETMYMGSPFVREGGFFRTDGFTKVSAHVSGPARRVRAWDLASTLNGDWTVGLLLAKDPQDFYTIEDVVRGRWRPGERDAKIKSVAAGDPVGTVQVFEEEGGSAGLAQVDNLRRLLRGFRVESVRHTGDKIVRAGPVASCVETGQVRVADGPWCADFFSELEAFPNSKHDDQVDALSLAWNTLVKKAVGSSVWQPQKSQQCLCAVGPHGLVFHHPDCPLVHPADSDLGSQIDQRLGTPKNWRIV